MSAIATSQTSMPSTCEIGYQATALPPSRPRSSAVANAFRCGSRQKVRLTDDRRCPSARLRLVPTLITGNPGVGGTRSEPV